jgi:hypothetical protein
MAIFQKAVNNLQLAAAVICCSVTAFMMAVSTYGLMPNATFGVVMALATVALDAMHYLSWPLARWKLQEGRYGIAGLLIFCGGCIACFSIAATSNQMIQVLLSDSTKHEAELKVRLPVLQEKLGRLTHDLESTTFAERAVSNEEAVRADIAATRKEASGYRQIGRMRNAEATEAVADSKEANLRRELSDVDAWNQAEAKRVEDQRESLKTELDQVHAEMFAIQAKAPRHSGVPTEVLEWLLRGFAAALVIFPSVILSSLSVGAATAPGRRSKANIKDQVDTEPAADLSAPLPALVELPAVVATPAAPAAPATPAAVTAEHNSASEPLEVAQEEGGLPADLTDLYGSLQAIVERAEPGGAIAIGRVAKELRTSPKRLMRVYPFARERGLLEQTAQGHWVKPIAI